MSKVMVVGLPKRTEQKVVAFFKSVRIECDRAVSIDEAVQVLPESPPILLVVQQPPSIPYLDNLNSAIKKHAPQTPYLVALERHRLEAALEVMNAGAYDCLEPGFTKLALLAAAKRASKNKGRDITIPKIVLPQRRTFKLIASVAVALLFISVINRIRNGPPPASIGLDSNFISGIQWEGRHLWSGDWFNSTVTKFTAKKGFTRKSRKLVTDSLYRMKDGQPILVCNTPEALVTIGNDLVIRTHRWDVGLPTLQSVKSPSSRPTGLAWDGDHLWSSDAVSSLLYRHDRFLRVIETERSLIPNPVALTWGEKSLWVVGGDPLALAQMERKKRGVVWHGPYPLVDWIPREKTLTGLATAFENMWVILDGSSTLISKKIKSIKNLKTNWKEKETVEEVG